MKCIYATCNLEHDLTGADTCTLRCKCLRDKTTQTLSAKPRGNSINPYKQCKLAVVFEWK